MTLNNSDSLEYPGIVTVTSAEEALEVHSSSMGVYYVDESIIQNGRPVWKHETDYGNDYLFYNGMQSF